jgi:iron complex outermembrane receptor protein
MRHVLLFNIIFCSLFKGFGQYKGVILSAETKEPIKNARVISDQKETTKSDEKGVFQLPNSKVPFTLSIYSNEYAVTKVLIEKLDSPPPIFLQLKEKDLNTVVVTAGRRDQKIEEVPISMEIIKTDLVTNKGMTNLAQAVNQSPGVYSMDGQVSIRGGGGFAYGAGSRVLLLWNGIPMLSPDIGDAKWNAIPIEQASQIEILKGASSVLYGSGALNGIIALNEKEPGPEGVLQIKIQSGIYDDPKRSSLKWWTRNPTFHMRDVYFGQTIKKFGFSFGSNVFLNEGFRQGEDEKRVRINGSLFYRPDHEKLKIKTGLSYNLQLQDAGVFVLWKNDSACYQPMDNSLSRQKAIRINVDPYLKIMDDKNNKHFFKTRYYLVTTGNETNVYDASNAQSFYFDYQYQRKMNENSNVTAGVSQTLNIVKSRIFGNHLSENAAAYTQFEHRKGKWDVTLGMRLEFFKMDTLPVDSKLTLGSNTLPIYPIFRAAVHYEPSKGTHLRASFGQGIRFPSVAERFVSTSVGGIVIFANPNLRPEKAVAAEIGLKQVFKIGDWIAMADVAGFVNYYTNMTEFTFGVYKPDTMAALQTTDPNALNYFYKWVGFQAKNAEKALISGIEFSFNSSGKIKKVEISSLLGYTYMNPMSLNFDPNYRLTFSDTTTNLLKYRFKHMVKADVQCTYKGFSVGISSRYNSYMKNIDKIFETGVLGQDLLVGLDDYRAKNNKGLVMFDARMGYQFTDRFKLNFIANNFLNQEYVTRPGDVQAPRNFILQLQWSL